MPSLAALAAAYAEGFGQPDAIPTIANNPGDLKVGDVGYGTINGITIFGSLEDGWNRLESQLSGMINGGSKYYSPDQTIASAGQTYGGGASWGNNFASYLGVPTDTKLSDLKSFLGSDSSTRGLFGKGSGILGSSWHLNPITGFSKFSMTDWAVIIVGLILLAAGVFSFKQTQTIITTIGGHVKRGAEVGAELAA